MSAMLKFKSPRPVLSAPHSIGSLPVSVPGRLPATRRRLHAVIVDEELPYPPNSGKRIRVLNLALHLARSHRLTFLCHRNPDAEESAKACEYFHAHDIETQTVAPAGAARLAWGCRALLPLKAALNLFSRVPYSVQWHRCDHLVQAVKQYAAQNDVDLWQCEWAPYATVLMGSGRRPWIMMAHDIQTLIWQRQFLGEGSRLKRSLIRQQCRRYRRYEQSVFADADLTITVTRQDADRASGEFGARRTAVVENGVDVPFYQAPAGEYAAGSRDAKRILFVANLQWRPNLDAVRLLLDEIMPRVRHEEPSAKLVLVGRSPPHWLKRRCEGSPDVELHADPPDVRGFFYQCGALAVPLRFASGSRLKILEALATDLPVVSTAVGAEGLRLTAGVHFAKADDPSEMAQTILRWIRHPEEAAALACAGRRVVEREYDWRVLATRMEEAWHDLLASRSREGTRLT